MPQKPKLPRYVEHNRAKGRDYYKVRYKGQRIGRLPDDPESPEFFEAYAALMRRITEQPKSSLPDEGSLRWLITEYKSSPDYKSLAPKTQRDYAREFERLRSVDHFPATDIKRRHIAKIRNKLDGKPRTQQLFGQVCSLLFNYGITELELEMLNPASKLKRADDPDSYLAWSPEQMNLFEESKPPVELMTAYMVARYTGPRRGDIVGLMRNHYDGTHLAIAGSKNQNPVTVPVHKALKAYLDKLPETLYIIVDALGRPISPTALTHGMREHLDSIGLKDLHLHGLRHTAGKVLAEAGCTPHEIAAVLGHKTLQMVEHYTKKAQQRRLAGAAIIRMENGNKT